MTSSRIEEYLHSIELSEAARGRSASELGELCAEVVGVTGAGVMLMTGGEHRGCISASDEALAIMENLQFTLGEGPCIDASNTGRPVLEADLGAAGFSRWPMFTGPAVEAGIRAVFAFPLLVQGACLGSTRD